MSQRIVIIGAGFAGYMSALAARRLVAMSAQQGIDAAAHIEVTVIAPEPALVIRPRLYEADPASMRAPLGDLFDAAGVGFLAGAVEAIRTESHEVDVVDPEGRRSTVSYAQLVLAAGSHTARPSSVPGLGEHAFFVDTLDSAARLEKHLQSLAGVPPAAGHDTIVVCGGGYTGIELAAELPGRLARIHGADAAAAFRVVVVEAAGELGPDLAPGLRAAVTQALQALGVAIRLGAAVTAIDADGVVTAAGERIPTATPVWTAGVTATPLARQMAGAARDGAGRLLVDATLRVPGVAGCFAAGDAASAPVDAAAGAGRRTLPSCQHALPMGRYAGHNAAAALLGLAPLVYSQPDYKTCLDLGARGAIYSEGWDGAVKLTGAEADPVKRFINEQLIYPPKATAEAAFAAADPVNRSVIPIS